jgi:hypothetical protein
MEKVFQESSLDEAYTDKRLCGVDYLLSKYY